METSFVSSRLTPHVYRGLNNDNEWCKDAAKRSFLAWITDTDANEFRFDVAQYKPEEVTVKTVDNRLLVHAKHEEKTPSRTVFREYNQVPYWLLCKSFWSVPLEQIRPFT